MGRSGDSQKKDTNAARRNTVDRTPPGSKKNQKFGDSERHAATRRGGTGPGDRRNSR